MECVLSYRATAAPFGVSLTIHKVDCHTTPAYRQSVVTVEQYPSRVFRPDTLLPENSNIASSNRNAKRRCINIKLEGDDVTDADVNGAERKVFPQVHLKDEDNQHETVSSEPDQSNVIGSSSGSDKDVGVSEAVAVKTSQDSENAEKNSKKMACFFVYPPVFASPPGNESLRHVPASVQASNPTASTSGTPRSVAPPGTPINPSLGFVNPGQHQHRAIGVPYPTTPYMSPFVLPPMYASTPANAPSVEDIRRWRAGTPSLEEIRRLYTGTNTPSFEEMRRWQANVSTPSADEMRRWQANVSTPSADEMRRVQASALTAEDIRRWQERAHSLLPPSASPSLIHCPVPLRGGTPHLLPAASAAMNSSTTGFVAPTLLPSYLHHQPSGRRYLTPFPGQPQAEANNHRAEQSLPLDLSGRNVDGGHDGRENQCRKSLFPANRSSMRHSYSHLATASGQGFNSTPDSGVKVEDSGHVSDSISPQTERSSTHSSGIASASGNSGMASASGSDEGFREDERNPFGIRKILGVQKSPVKAERIGNSEGFHDHMALPKSGVNLPKSDGEIAKPGAKSKHKPASAKRRLSLSEGTGSGGVQRPAKKSRDKPPSWGSEAPRSNVVFYECAEKQLYCDDNGHYKTPDVPEEFQEQEDMRNALLRLFENSNLPAIPLKLRDNLLGLRYFPKMITIQQASEHIDTSTLNVSPGGLAFENFRTQENNTVIDTMLKKEGEVYHCLGRKCIDSPDSVCTFTAKTLGKMRRHVKNHMPDKKWVCSFCRAQMTDQTDMSRHGTTHTNLRPFRCYPCEKDFTQKVTLINHLKTNHNITLKEENTKNRFTCRQCGVHYGAMQREECINHLLIFHRTTLYVSLRKKNRFPFNTEEE